MNDIYNQSPEKSSHSTGVSCCGHEASGQQRSIDWLLWGSLSLVIICYGLTLWTMAGGASDGIETAIPQWLGIMSHSVFELINTMWWSVVLAAVFVGILGRIPEDLITAVLGRGGSFKGIFRATMAGVLLDLCSHGILMVGMKLYKKGASLGQVMAFLIASPWNSLSLTLILIALIGWYWTLAFIALSMLIAMSTGYLFDVLVARKVLPGNGQHKGLPDGYRFWSKLGEYWRGTRIDAAVIKAILSEGIKGSQVVVRWLLFGVLLASTIRAFVDIEQFQSWFGPGLLGLTLTLVAATVIEVCSEGSTPIAADLLTRAGAPGNSFAFLMTGVATDYTEVMVVRDTMSSWKVALFLPLLTVPQVVVVAAILNLYG